MSILSFIASSNFIVVNRELIKQLGLEEAILIGELASEYDYWNKKEELQDGYFYSTIENVEENTGLSEFKQRKLFKNLIEKEIIDMQIKGIPARRYVKINEEQVLNIVENKFLNNSRTSSLIIKEQELEKPKGNNNIINKNIINNNNNNKEEDIYEFVENNYGRTLAPIEVEKIKSWKEYFSEDMIKYAFELSIIKNARNFSYVGTILRNWYDNQIKTLQQAKAKINEYGNNKQTKPLKKQQQEEKELPNWFSKDLESEKMTKEEYDELESLLNSMSD